LTDIDISLFPATLDAFDGDEQRAIVFLDRYAAKGPLGEAAETLPEESWQRVARAMAGDDDELYEEYLGILRGFKFVPGGRIMAGAGIEAEVTFYNCYVIPLETRARRKNRQPAEWLEAVSTNADGEEIDRLERRIPPLEADPGNDSREAIFDTIGLMVDIMSRGGGVGINWSVLRPQGAYLKRVNGTSSGPVGWMDVASKAVGEVEQGGSRRGAAMFMIDDWHPDVLKFITAKEDYARITNANVSVCVSDAFMDAVARDAVWQLQFPDTGHAAYNTEWGGDLQGWIETHGLDAVTVYEEVRARDLWDAMAESAWKSGEPGIIFLDRYNKQSTGKNVERIICVNPCGEQGLGAYSVCNLGSMNLQAYVRDYSEIGQTTDFTRPRGARNVTETSGPPSFDYEAFTADAKVAIRFMDAVIDKNYYFIPENETIQKDLRRTGLGIMGLADALIGLGLKYGSSDAVEFTEAVYRTLKDAAIETSRELAAQKGPAPAWRQDMIDEPYIAEYLERYPWRREDIARTGLRNIFLLTQAPTGTTSILAGVNSGIEPLFALQWTRKDRTGTHRVKAPAVTRYFDKQPPYVFVTAAEISVDQHIDMQAAAQRYIDSSVSKTINGPKSHTVEDVKAAYQQAYDKGLKGLAYFRDGSGRDQVLYKDEPVEKVDDKDSLIAQLKVDVHEMAELARVSPNYVRPEVMSGRTIKVQTKSEAAYVTINRDDSGTPREVFINVGKSGDDITAMAEALGRLISLALRKGATLGGVANQLEGIGGMTNLNWSKSIPHAVGQALTEENRREAEVAPLTDDSTILPSDGWDYDEWQTELPDGVRPSSCRTTSRTRSRSATSALRAGSTRSCAKKTAASASAAASVPANALRRGLPAMAHRRSALWRWRRELLATAAEHGGGQVDPVPLTQGVEHRDQGQEQRGPGLRD
jgi:ribonucleoside-diphosphate reductase alpha chain